MKPMKHMLQRKKSLSLESGPAQTKVEVAVQAESALRAVRIVLGILAAFVVLVHRPLTGQTDWQSLGRTVGTIVLAVSILNLVSTRLRRTALRLAIGQLYDIMAIVGLASVLNGPLGQETWALLLIPIVSAAVRLGAAASLITWAAGCLLYQAAAWRGLVTGLDDNGLIIRAPGTLLAIAITVGLLARWMREGWEIQNELTAQATRREHRLSIIETASRELTHLSVVEALQLCASQTLALGFDAATVHLPGTASPEIAVGRCEIVAASGGFFDHGPSTVVTAWTEADDIVVNSASIVEPQTGAVIAAWSNTPVDADRAQAFTTLVSHTAAAIASATIRARLEDTAARDSLTSLANRRTFDAELEIAAQGPGPISLAFIDVNDFKMLNDEYGHLVGDKVLVSISRRIESAVGDRGLVARFGGDEFVVLLPNTAITDAQVIAGAIAESMLEPIVTGQTQVEVALSIGIAGGQTPVSPMDLVRSGDQAAYQAKSRYKAKLYRETSAKKLLELENS